MHTQPQNYAAALDDLEKTIRSRIVQRTAGRIRGLTIAVVDDAVCIHGIAASFHLKQLALQGVVDAIGSVGAMRIELDIEVDPIRLMPDDDFEKVSTSGRGTE